MSVRNEGTVQKDIRKYVALISGDLPEVSVEEIKGLLEGYKIMYRIIYKDPFVVIFEADRANSTRLSSRFSLVKAISEFLGIYSSIDEVFDRIKRIAPMFSGRKFYIRVFRLGSFWPKSLETPTLEKDLGRIIADSKAKVSFLSPDIVLNVYFSKKIVLGILKEIRRDKTLLRRPSMRPFSKPISMNPRVAKAMVNMARVVEGSSVLDPFCGTGAILIEAGLMGMRVLGSDINEEMVSGTLKNLEYFGIKPEKIVRCDIREIDKYFSDVDAIVCDPPYGRSASTYGHDLVSLYDDSFKAFKRVLKDEGYAVVCFSNPMYHYEIGAKHMRLISVVSYKVHKSLRRYIGVYKNSSG